MQSGSDNWPLVIPLLTPAVQNALQQERDRWQHSIDFQRERIADASSDDERRRSQKRLEEMLNRENWWMAPWLRLIGGTRHPDAREIVLPYLKDPNHQAREGAVLGLEAFADAPVRTRLTELVKQESKPSVLAAALRVLGRTGGPKELPPILDAGAEPMPIVTRIAWIEAVTTLGGLDQIRPRLESLVKSPNEGLATAAEKALARD